MKKSAIILALMLALSGCAGNVNVDDLISARELPEYKEVTVDIEVSDTEAEKGDDEVIVIE